MIGFKMFQFILPSKVKQGKICHETICSIMMYSKQTPLAFAFWGNSNYPSNEPLQKPISVRVKFFRRMDGSTAMNRLTKARQTCSEDDAPLWNGEHGEPLKPPPACAHGLCRCQYILVINQSAMGSVKTALLTSMLRIETRLHVVEVCSSTAG
jgi:hypothetical protein